MKSRHKPAKGTPYSYEDSYDDRDFMFPDDDSSSDSQSMLMICGGANVVDDYIANPSNNTICKAKLDLVSFSY